MKLQEFATGGAVAICLEASTVAPDGTYHIQRCIIEFLHAQGTRIGIWLVYAGSKTLTHTSPKSRVAGSNEITFVDADAQQPNIKRTKEEFS